MPDDIDGRLALRRSIGRAASAATAARAATGQAAVQLVRAISEGALSTLGHTSVVVLAQRTDAATTRSALVYGHVKDLQRAESLLKESGDVHELQAACQSALKDGEALCEEADAIQRQLSRDIR